MQIDFQLPGTDDFYSMRKQYSDPSTKVEELELVQKDFKIQFARYQLPKATTFTFQFTAPAFLINLEQGLSFELSVLREVKLNKQQLIFFYAPGMTVSCYLRKIQRYQFLMVSFAPTYLQKIYKRWRDYEYVDEGIAKPPCLLTKYPITISAELMELITSITQTPVEEEKSGKLYAVMQDFAQKALQESVSPKVIR